MKNFNQKLMQVGGIEVLVIKKNIKNLHLNVLPPNGNVRVSAPVATKDGVIQTFLSSKINWIRKKQTEFKEQERESPREYVSGEDHYLFGRRYILEVVYDFKKAGVEIKNNKKIIFTVKPNCSIKNKEKILERWYRERLKEFIENNRVKREEKIGITANEIRIKKMKTRWGSCNHKAKRVWLNLELAKKPANCIDYVLVHELIHLTEQKHNNNFVVLLEKYFSNWKNEKQKLNKFILSYEKWRE